MARTRHYFLRPNWTCVTCGEPWPCAARRARFLDSFARRPLELRGVLGAFALDAQRNLHLTREQSHQRFIAWTFQA